VEDAVPVCARTLLKRNAGNNRNIPANSSGAMRIGNLSQQE
jgi:hypothetical protein